MTNDEMVAKSALHDRQQVNNAWRYSAKSPITILVFS
jgi:hypothetical protein